MKFCKLLCTAICLSLFLFSCSSDDDNDVNDNQPLGAYENGFFVLNEGTASKGSVSFVNNDLSFVKQDIFGAENAGDGMGGFVQSVFFDGDRAFIIAGGSNKITVVNRYTFKLIAKIDTGMEEPRYGVVLNGKAYVTNLAAFDNLTDDFITVINLSNYQVETPIAVNAIADRITEENGKLYVLNGSYGDGSTIKIIHPADGSISTIELGQSPASFEEYNGKLYVLTANFSDPSKLVTVDFATDAIESTMTLPASLVNAQNLNIENDRIYFTVNSNVYDEEINTASISETPLFTSAATTLYGFSVRGDGIYISDAKDYDSDGEMFVYSNSGTLIYSTIVGLIPNGFYFN